MTKWSNQYKDPRWQKKRLEVMEANDYTCEICGDDRSTLNVHHKHYDYEKRIWEYDVEEFQCLCEDCHEKLHEDQKRIKKLMERESFRRFSLSLWDAFLEDYDCEDEEIDIDRIINCDTKVSLDLINISRRHFDYYGATFSFVYLFMSEFTDMIDNGTCNDEVKEEGIHSFLDRLKYATTKWIEK